MNYRDPAAAITWLTSAFGLQAHAVYRDDGGSVVHTQMTFGNGMIMLGPVDKGEFGVRYMTMPDATGGLCTQTVYVIVGDVDAHHAHAKAAGAEILMAPKDQDYGGRSYAARDPEGHVWSFGSYDPWAASDNA